VHLAVISGTLIILLAVLFAVIQSPALFQRPAGVAAAIPHPLEGFRECESCHGLKGDIPYPIRHLGWSIESCTRCHEPSDHAAMRHDRYHEQRSDSRRKLIANRE
jgi:hypothetical protein